MAARRGDGKFPITTDDLTVLIEREADELDLYADLSGEEGNVEGVTEFRVGKKPRVLINRQLSEAHNLENRLRTTLASPVWKPYAAAVDPEVLLEVPGYFAPPPPPPPPPWK